jgi:uncharacterized protein with ParB-like and HNH nuclease domain
MEPTEVLLKEIENRRTSFKTDSYPMSIGELANLYTSKEITIRPEYQRLFRWTQGQKVKLIESILLGIPIPSIFVFQDPSGKWELVDGLQRVSTIFQFLGILDGADRLQLNGTKYLPSLDGYFWESKTEDELEVPDAVKLSFKRSKLNFTIILSESDKRAKFEVFQRLNTGGSNASNQEIRNNVMLMLNETVYKWFIELSDFPAFQNSISLSERLYFEQYHMELLLRYIALVYFPYNQKKDVGDYLDDVNETILTDIAFPFEQVGIGFKKTFETLNNLLDEKSFKKFDGANFKGKFLESAFETVAVGLGANIQSYTFPADNDLLLEKIQNLYAEETYTLNAGSGSNAKTRIPRLVPFAKDFFKK